MSTENTRLGWWGVTSAIALAMSGASSAHHSIAGIYGNERATIDGIVAEFHYVNPHPFVTADVKDATGTVQRWRLEMDNRSELAQIGVTATTLMPGNRIVVTGSLGRTQPHSMYVRRLDRPADGFWYEQVGSSPRIRPAS
jgi:hypothetical protein